MKKITLFLILITAYSAAKCQLDKGTWLAGGSGSFYSYHHEIITYPETSSRGNYTNIQLSASFGYFVIDKLALGLRPTFFSLKGHDIGQGSVNTQNYTIGPFARYYFLNKEKQYNLQADVSYLLGVNNRGPHAVAKGKFNTFSIMAGPEIYFNTSVGLEILVGYSTNIQTLKDSDHENLYYEKQQGFQMSAGIQIHLQNY